MKKISVIHDRDLKKKPIPNTSKSNIKKTRIRVGINVPPVPTVQPFDILKN